MSLYTVHRRDGDAPDTAVLVRDGFCWGAFVFGILWALWNRMWVVAAVLLLIDGVVAAASTALGAGPVVPGLINFAVALLFGFEARDLKRRSLAATGRREVAITAGATVEEAELTYFADAVPDVVLPGPWRSVTPASPDTLGLFGRA